MSGKGALHGGVASLIDDTMRLSAATLVGLGKATIGLDVHFLGPVKEGKITCAAEVVRRTRHIATVEANVSDGEGTFMASCTGTCRIFEKRGAPIV